ncbi:MAG: aminotransferase class IV [Clostridium sp.]
MNNIIINGVLTEDKSINLDSGFFFGKGLFETIYITNKAIFLEKHLNRLNMGLNTLNIKKKVYKDEVEKAIGILGCENKALKIMVSEENTIISMRHIGYTKGDYERGFALKISGVKRNPYSNMTYLKSFNYYENIIEREKVVKEGYNEVMFFNVHNFLSEGSLSNIFFVKNKTIYTPAVKCGLLNGIVREIIIEKVKEDNIFDIKEGNFTFEDIVGSEGAFITNSLLGVMKVNSIDGTKIKESIITEYVHNLYESLIYR